MRKVFCRRRSGRVLELFNHLDALTAKLAAVDRNILAWHKASEASQRLATAPGVGPPAATALIAAVDDASRFTSARHFAAWLGLTPRISASGNREHIGRIGKGGDRDLRTLLIHGARAMAGTRVRRGVRPRPWLQALIARRPVSVAAVAVVNKTARALRAMIRREEAYRPCGIRSRRLKEIGAPHLVAPTCEGEQTMMADPRQPGFGKSP